MGKVNDLLNLYVVDYFEQINGGLSTYVDNLTNSLKKSEKVNLNIIFVKSGSVHKSFLKETKGGITYLYFPEEIGRNFSEDDDDELLIELLVGETTGLKNLIFHFNWINHASFSFLLKKKIDCKTILTNHCLPWRDLITINYPLFKNIEKRYSDNTKVNYLHKFLIREKVAYDSFDYIICVTDFANQILKYCFEIPEEKLFIIYNGLSLKRSQRKDKNQLKDLYGFEKVDKIILFAGAVNERKGVFDLISAFQAVLAKNINIHLVIAGKGDLSSLINKIKKNWSKISIVGHLDKPTLADLYMMADIGIVPSYVEQCSYSSIEMMRYGLPIIVSDVDGLKEILPNGYGIKIPLQLGKNKASLDSVKFKDAILSLLENPQLANSYSIKAKAFSERKFSINSMIKDTIKVYEKAITLKKQHDNIENFKKSSLVSIILPCYNAERFLEECLQSIFAQSYTNFELIAIDDGSSDLTREILEKQDDNRLKILSNTTNLGIVKSLNSAIDFANGKYIARMDADDIMHKNRLMKQVAFLESIEGHNVDVLGSNHYVINQKGKLTGLKYYPRTHEEIEFVSLFQNPLSHPSVMFRSEVIKRNKYKHDYSHAEDYSLWFDLLKVGKFSNIPECLMYYRVHQDNVSLKNDNIQKQNVAGLLASELERMGLDLSVSDFKQFLAICFGQGSMYFNNSEKLSSLDSLITRIISAKVQQNKNNAYSNKFLREIKIYIMENICGIYR